MPQKLAFHSDIAGVKNKIYMMYTRLARMVLCLWLLAIVGWQRPAGSVGCGEENEQKLIDDRLIDILEPARKSRKPEDDIGRAAPGLTPDDG